MNTYTLQQPGKIGTYTIAAIIFVITVLFRFAEDIFVVDGGKFEIFGNFGLLLVIGLLWKWNYIREIVSFLTFLATGAFLMTVIMAPSFSFPIFAVMIGMSVAFYLSTFSKDVKMYLGNPI